MLRFVKDDYRVFVVSFPGCWKWACWDSLIFAFSSLILPVCSLSEAAVVEVASPLKLFFSSVIFALPSPSSGLCLSTTASGPFNPTLSPTSSAHPLNPSPTVSRLHSSDVAEDKWRYSRWKTNKPSRKDNVRVDKMVVIARVGMRTAAWGVCQLKRKPSKRLEKRTGDYHGTNHRKDCKYRKSTLRYWILYPLSPTHM